MRALLALVVLAMLAGCAAATLPGADPARDSADDAPEFDTRIVRIGERDITFPYPADYVAACEADERVAEVFDATVPPTHRRLGCFIGERTYRALTRSEPVTADRFGLLETARRHQAHRFDGTGFDRVKAQVRMQTAMRETPKAEARRVSQLEPGMGRSISLGVVDEGERHIAVGDLRQRSLEQGVWEVPYGQVSIATFVHARGKVLYLVTFSEFNDWRDLERLWNFTHEWTERVMAENPAT